jgi:hypothetical protein
MKSFGYTRVGCYGRNRYVFASKYSVERAEEINVLTGISKDIL